MTWRLAVAATIGLAATAPGRPDTFRVTERAGAALRALWQESSTAKEERVACLGGHVAGDTVYVDQVLPLDPALADSLGIGAQVSIDDCGPPDWFGTVHTHVAQLDGRRAYPNFSGADRGVMLLWVRRWRTDGMFCVLYSATGAHCEVDGVDGVSIVPGVAY